VKGSGSGLYPVENFINGVGPLKSDTTVTVSIIKCLETEKS